MANKQLKLPNTKYAVVNISNSVGDNTNSLEPLAWFTTEYANKIIDAVDFGSSGGGTSGGDVTREQFNNEVQARKDGDATLTTNLNQEIQDRENADTTLQENIDAEKTARENADTTLQENIDAEKTARENADTTLTTNLNNEIKARTDGDATLTTNLNQEIQDRENADTTLQNNINSEVNARTGDIENVNSAINTETNARISADNAINQKLTQETTERKQKDAIITATIEDYWKTIYPVGSIYISTSQTFNPQTTWGGSWRKTANGRCLIGANNTYPLGSTGGEATHTLSVNEMPSHSHNTVNKYILANEEGEHPVYFKQGNDSRVDQSARNTDEVGGNQPHNNMQPYLAVYIWERTA